MAFGDLLTSKYWNCGDSAVAIVAYEGAVKDVGAYIGADVGPSNRREDTEEHVHRHGCKLSRTQALAMLPGIQDFLNDGYHYRN